MKNYWKRWKRSEKLFHWGWRPEPSRGKSQTAVASLKIKNKKFQKLKNKEELLKLD